MLHRFSYPHYITTNWVHFLKPTLNCFKIYLGPLDENVSPEQIFGIHKDVYQVKRVNSAKQLNAFDREWYALVEMNSAPDLYRTEYLTTSMYVVPFIDLYYPLPPDHVLCNKCLNACTLDHLSRCVLPAAPWYLYYSDRVQRLCRQYYFRVTSTPAASPVKQYRCHVCPPNRNRHQAFGPFCPPRSGAPRRLCAICPPGKNRHQSNGPYCRNRSRQKRDS